jgi:DNA repair protein RadA/Sms
VELQALVGSTSFGNPRRTILGLDSNRVALLAAVIEKKMGMHLMGQDIFMNVAGGVKVDEPSIDMGIISAITSSFLDKPISEETLVIGEVGLTGEVRAVSRIDIRITEAKKMGFKKLLLPAGNLKRISNKEGIELVGISTISEGIDELF